MTVASSNLDAWIASGAADFDRFLARVLAEHAKRAPQRLSDAMAHAVLAGGKRLRPYVVIESAALMGVPAQPAMLVAAALECLHCYSLVHDDLPAMDDDDLRRGRPTVHRAFDEATAILAGDALLTLAFGLLADPASGLEPVRALRLVSLLADAAGARGMVGGQMLDLAAEGRFGAGAVNDENGIIAIQSMKTGALFRFAAISGAIAGDAAPEDTAALARFGEALGLAFQIRDDLIDAEGDAATAGKATGKDRDAGKGTFVTLLGSEGARARLEIASSEGHAALHRFGAKAAPLAALLTFNLRRHS